jgi:hypothetical protein
LSPLFIALAAPAVLATASCPNVQAAIDRAILLAADRKFRSKCVQAGGGQPHFAVLIFGAKLDPAIGYQSSQCPFPD